MFFFESHFCHKLFLIKLFLTRPFDVVSPYPGVLLYTRHEQYIYTIRTHTHTHTHTHRIKQRALETSQQGVWNIQYQMLNHFNIV